MLSALALGLLFLLPFERIPSFDIAGITIRLSALVIVAFLFFLPGLIRQKRLLPISWIDKSILFFYLAAALSLIAATNRERSLLVLIFIGVVIVGYLLISRTFRQSFSWDTISKVILTTACISAVFGLFQFFGDAVGLSQSITGLEYRYTGVVFGFARIQSFGLEPLYYANFLLFPLIISARNILENYRRPKDITIFVLLLWVFILTLSRGAYLALAIGLTVLLVSLIWQRKKTYRIKPLLFGIITAIILVYSSIWVVGGQRGIRTFITHAIGGDEQHIQSAAPRLKHADEALRLFHTSPLFGVGIGNYGVLTTVPPDADDQGYAIVNNQYIETLAETGIIGFVAFLSIGLAVCMKLWRAARTQGSIAILLFAVIVAILVQYNFFSTIYIVYLWAILGVIDALPERSSS